MKAFKLFIFISFPVVEIVFSSVLFGQSENLGSFTTSTIIPERSVNIAKSDFTAGNIFTDVELMTGRSNVNISIATLKSYDLSIPISVNYLSGGVKVDQASSWVGIDWNLQTGGTIQREIKDLPDDTPVKGYFYLSNLVKSFNSTIDISTISDNSGNDLEPDIFHYSIGNYNGSFMINDLKEIVFIPSSNLIGKFSLNESNIILGFDLITPEGTCYSFGNNGSDIEKTKVSVESCNFEKVDDVSWEITNVEHKDITEEPYISEWYLSKIHSITGDQIIFSYTEPIVYSFANSPLNTYLRFWGNSFTDNSTHRYLIDNDVLASDGGAEDEGWDSWSFPERYIHFFAYSQERVTKFKKYITEIKSKSGNRLLFESDFNRPDLPGSKRITKIKLFNSSNILQQTFTLNHKNVVSKSLNPSGSFHDPFNPIEGELFRSIFTSESSGLGIPANLAISNCLGIDNKGLDLFGYTLEGLKHYNYYRLFLESIIETIDNEVVNSYEFKYIYPEDLVRRTSCFVDFYGYNIDDPGPIGKKGNLQSTPGFIDHTNLRPERKILEHSSQRGLLETVIMHNGSSTKYTYEDNYENAGSRVHKITKSDNANVNETFYFYDNPQINKISYQKERFFYENLNRGSIATVSEIDPECLRFSIIENRKYLIASFTSYNTTNQNFIFNGSNIIYNEVKFSNNEELKNGYTEFIFKKIENLPTNIINYCKPVLKYNQFFFGRDLEDYWETRTGKLDAPFGTIKSFMIFYPKLDYSQYTQDRTIFTKEQITDYYEDLSLYRGKILEKNIFKVNNGIEKPVSKTIYEYEPFEENEENMIYGILFEKYSAFQITSLEWNDIWHGNYHSLQNVLKEAYLLQKYSIKPKYEVLKNVMEIFYDESKKSVFTQVTYDNEYLSFKNKTYLLVKGSSQNINGKITNVLYKYPFDYLWPQEGNLMTTGYASMLKKLIDKNILFPIESTTTNNGQVVQSTLNYYSENEQTGCIVLNSVDELQIKEPISLPSTGLSYNIFTYDDNGWQSVSFHSNPLYKKQSINSYDDYGRLIETTPTDGLTNSVYYNSNNQVVASALNAKSDEIYFNNFETFDRYLSATDCFAGTYSYTVEPAEFSETMQLDWDYSKTGKYKAQVWVKTPSNFTGTGNLVIEINDPNTGTHVTTGGWQSTSIANTNGEWKRFEKIIDMDAIKTANPSVSNFIIKSYVWNSEGNEAIFADDFSFAPVDARMTTSSFDKWGNVLATSDSRGRYVHNEYDTKGRLIRQRDHNRNIIKETEYNIQTPFIADEVHSFLFDALDNVPKSYLINKNNVHSISVTSNDAFITTSASSESEDKFILTITLTNNGLSQHRFGSVTLHGTTIAGESFEKVIEIEQLSMGLNATYTGHDFESDMFYQYTQIDNNINFIGGDYGSDHEGPAHLRSNYFDIVWEGYIIAPYSGTFMFYLDVDDTGHLIIDGETIIQNTAWGNNFTETKYLEAGVPTPIKLIYNEETGNAFATLKWASVSGLIGIIPAEYFRTLH